MSLTVGGCSKSSDVFSLLAVLLGILRTSMYHKNKFAPSTAPTFAPARCQRAAPRRANAALHAASAPKRRASSLQKARSRRAPIHTEN